MGELDQLQQRRRELLFRLRALAQGDRRPPQAVGSRPDTRQRLRAMRLATEKELASIDSRILDLIGEVRPLA